MISLQQIKLLSDAVDDAESWRGNMIGAAPDWAIERFDKKIAKMRKAVQAARLDRQEIKTLRLALEFGTDYKERQK